MAIEKKLKNFGRKAVIGTALVGSLALIGCASPGKSDDPKSPGNPIVNQEPNTVIGKDFGDGLTGDVEYTVCGDDSDGFTNYLEVWTNGNYSKHINFSQENPYCIYPTVSIIPGTNTLEAIASDNDGADDSTPASDSFVSPTESEARAKIEEILDARGYVEGVDYEKDQIIIVNEDMFNVDYWFKNPDTSTKGVFNYISHQDNLTDEQFYKSRVDAASIYNLYLARVPLGELESKFTIFLDAL